jgi:hypothetical protein
MSIDELGSPDPEVDDIPKCPLTSSEALTLRLTSFLLSIVELGSLDPDVDDLPGCPLTSSAALALRLMTYLAVH